MNCLDCLDRTNAVQSFIALEVCLSAIYILSWAAGGMGWAQHPRGLLWSPWGGDSHVPGI